MAALVFVETPESGETEDSLASAVIAGLSAKQKTLPCKFLYDSRGSQLFEEITRLPEYYLTSTEQAILEKHAASMIEATGRDIALVELGSGSSYKTRILIGAALEKQKSLSYMPIDISTQFLRESAESLIAEFDGLSVTAVAAEYEAALDLLPASDEPRLILFLGSNIGNFEHDEAVDFLKVLQKRMRASDRLLMGVDMLKDPAIIEAAYNDASGVTAEFNKNMLRRINAELGADFDLDQFDHYAPFLAHKSRVEMHLVSLRPQTVEVSGLGVSLDIDDGESIHTESSHKYTLESFRDICHRAGMEIQETWTDDRRWFSVFLIGTT